MCVKVSPEFCTFFFKLFQLRADVGGETDPGDRIPRGQMLKAPAEALPSACSCTHTSGRQPRIALGTPQRRGSGGWAAQEATGFRVCSHSWGMGCRDPLLLTQPLGQHTEITAGLEALPPCREQDATCIPATFPLALRCLLFLLCLAQTLPDLAPGQHTSLVPWAPRWARSILNGQHLAPEVSLCPQPRGGGSGEVPGAAWVSHAPATRQQVPGAPGCAPRLAAGWQPCPCLLPVPRGAARHEPGSLSHHVPAWARQGWTLKRVQVGTLSDTVQQ